MKAWHSNCAGPLCPAGGDAGSAEAVGPDVFPTRLGFQLMEQIAKRVEDKRLLKFIQAFVNAGVMKNGLVSPSAGGDLQRRIEGWAGHLDDKPSLSEALRRLPK